MSRVHAVRAAAFAAALVAAAGCGSSDETEQPSGGGETITIVSSLPLQGAPRVQSEDILRGQKLALAQAGGRAGRWRSS